MQQPEGFEVGDKTEKVCLLHKSLYGLKQSPRQWYLKFDTFMTQNGFVRRQYDWCVYFKDLKAAGFIYLLLYVDDMLIVNKEQSEIQKLKTLLSKHFQMKDLGPAKVILGMEIERDRTQRRLGLFQKRYLTKVLERFDMSEAKPVNTPIAHHFKLSVSQCPEIDEDKRYMLTVPYASAVGSLMYSMICSRPDIRYAISLVSRFMSNPGKAHWQAVKWVLRYIRGSHDTGIIYGCNNRSSEF